jgi:hypothetical protein
MLDYVVDQFIADGEYGDDVVMIGRCAWRRRATGAVVDSRKVDIWHFECGKATRSPKCSIASPSPKP